MRRRTITFIIVMLLVSSFALFANDSSNPEKQNHEVEFLLRAFKRAPEQKPGEEPNASLPEKDVPPTVIFQDSISTVLGTAPEMKDNIYLDPINMNGLLDEFFARGIHVAMITVTGTTGYAPMPAVGSTEESSCPFIPDEDNKFNAMRYSTRRNTITIEATPMMVNKEDTVEVSKNPLVTKKVITGAEEKGSYFYSSAGDAYPVEVIFKTSKLVTNEPHNNPIMKAPDKEVWYGYRMIDAWNKETKADVSTPYAEYMLTSTSIPASDSAPATLKLDFDNNTVHQETKKGSKGKTVEWAQYAANVRWTAESQLWIKGDRNTFDKLPPGDYKMVLKINVKTGI